MEARGSVVTGHGDPGRYLGRSQLLALARGQHGRCKVARELVVSAYCRMPYLPHANLPHAIHRMCMSAWAWRERQPVGAHSPSGTPSGLHAWSCCDWLMARAYIPAIECHDEIACASAAVNRPNMHEQESESTLSDTSIHIANVRAPLVRALGSRSLA